MSLEGQQVDRYRILRLLGSGGMGDVYLAEDARIEQQVAIKVIRAEVSPYPDAQATQEAARLFQREAKAIVKLDHPHILPLFDYGEEQLGTVTVIYLVMPYRQEGSLADWPRRRSQAGLLSPQEVAHIVGQAASALQHAHDRQIIHQDVKPSNFLLRHRSETPTRPDLLLADFGIAKFTTATSAISHTIRGTPTYMAPEQWEGHPVPATDQYSLAVMTYELLTGRSPFQGGERQVMYQHLMIPPTPPSTVNPQLSRDTDTVLLHAMTKQPEERFASITAFANAFQQAVQGMQEADAPTYLSALPTLASQGDTHAVLAISTTEAQTGTTRTLTLPGGRRVTVPVPAGVRDGQIVRLDGQGETSSAGGPAGALILSILVKAAEIPPPLSTANATVVEETVLTANPEATATDAPTVSNTGQQPTASNAARPEMSTSASHSLEPTEAATSASQGISPSTESALPAKPSVGRPEERSPVTQTERRASIAPVEQPSQFPVTITQQPARRGLSRRTVVVGLAGLAVIGVASGGLLWLARAQQPPPLTSGIRVLLVPAAGTRTPSRGQLDAVHATVSQRLAAFGLTNARVSQLVPASQPTLLVEVPHFGGDERGTLATLLETGNLEFWNTGQQLLQEGSTLDPSQFGGKPAFSSKDLDPSQIGMSNDQTGRPQLNFEMKGDAIASFGTFTKNNIGSYLTLTLDGTIISSAVINSSINGPAVISGVFTQQQVTALVSVLKYPPLPVALRISSESTFTR